MVADRITESRRVAQLLASELSGLAAGPLADVSVVDADPDATPAPGGIEAFAVSFRDRRVGAVSLYPDRVQVHLTAGDAGPAGETSERVPTETTAEGVTLWVESGATVKPAVDAVRAVLSDAQGSDV
jgi:hypothetical protein